MTTMNTSTNLNIYRIIEKYAEHTEHSHLDLKNEEDNVLLSQKMLELFQIICSVTGKIEVEITEEKMNMILMSLACDIFHEMKKDSCFIGMNHAVKAVVWRSGYLFAISPNILNDELTASLAEVLVNLIRFEQKKNPEPNQELMEKMLTSYEGLDETAAVRLTEQLQDQLGIENTCPAMYAKESRVCTFGHPVDSGIIKILDNPMINGVFRSYVDINADAFMGQVLATGITVNEQNYPEINRIVDECVNTLQIRRPYVVVSNQPGINAMTFGSDEEPYLVLTSLLVKVMNEEQLKFVIGHECGHIAMGHVVYHTAVSILSMIGVKTLLVGKAVLFALNAWSRRSEITADRAGLICCGDPETARKALIQLECAFRDASEIDIDAYTRNSKEYLSKGILRKLGEYGANHPLTPKRIEAISEFAKSRKYYEAMALPLPEDAMEDEKLANRVEDILKVL